MRISEWKGLWIKYRDSARPVITLNQIPYAFNNDARECLVSRADHVQYFLETGQYRISGIEVEDGKEPAGAVVLSVPSAEVVQRKPGRPKGKR